MGDHWYLQSEDPDVWRRGGDTVDGAEPPPTGDWAPNGLPLSGQTMFALASSSRSPDDVTTFENKIGSPGKVSMHRQYFQTDWSSAPSDAAAELAAGHIPHQSFKIPGTDWAGAAAGDYDDMVTTLASGLGALDGPVWVTFHHEPEGDGDAADYRAMQQHILPQFNAYPNVARVVVVTGYNQTFGYAGQTWDTFYPGDAYCDVYLADPYNFWSTDFNDTNWTWRENLVFYQSQVDWIIDNNHDVLWGAAETGWGDLAASIPQNYFDPDPPEGWGWGTISTEGPGIEWCERAWDDMAALGGIVFTYFDLNTVEIISQDHIAGAKLALDKADVWSAS